MAQLWLNKERRGVLVTLVPLTNFPHVFVILFQTEK